MIVSIEEGSVEGDVLGNILWLSIWIYIPDLWIDDGVECVWLMMCFLGNRG